MPRRPRLSSLRPSLAVADLRTARPAPKEADADLATAEHRAWRAIVIANAGGRCEWVKNFVRCERCEADGSTMFADHIVERRDGGRRYDPDNGQCLCGSHHTIKTNLEKLRRQEQLV
jgi:5-methylcytosine-specific restriction enzyme A